MSKVTSKVPGLRFAEFGGEWEEKSYGDIYRFLITNSFSRDKLNYDFGKVKNIHYGDIHTKFKTLFNMNVEIVPFINNDTNILRIDGDNYCQVGDLVIADASEDYNDIGKTIEIISLNFEKTLAGLHTFLARPIGNDTSIGFMGNLLKSWKIRKQIMTIAQGSKVLGISKTNLSKTKLNIPTKPEQQKIAAFLTAVDNKIEQLSKKQGLLGEYKKGVMQKIFSQTIRFKADDDSDFSDWEEKKLESLLDYEQPTKYLVNSTEYSNKYETPVLTAGKTFLLGYTNEDFGFFENVPVIIFDDFTTANKFVDFKFKAKSSAMKILNKNNNNVDVKFVYEAMQIICFSLGKEHKRYWISEYQKIKIKAPSFLEQTKIANFLSSIDSKTEQVSKQLDNSKQFKKSLLQQMFV